MVEKDKKEFLNLDVIQNVIKISDLRLFPFYLREVYKDLVERAESSKKKGISKITFLEYIKLPIFLSDKMFNALDKNKDDYLDEVEFVEGINHLYYGNLDQISQIIFNLYDFDKDGEINKEDIRIIFSYIPLTNEEKQIEGLKEIDNIIGNVPFSKNSKGKESLEYQKFLEVTKKTCSDLFVQILYYLYYNKPFSIENVEVCQKLPKFKNYINNNKDVEKSKLESDNFLVSPNKKTPFISTKEMEQEIIPINLYEEDQESITIPINHQKTKKNEDLKKLDPKDLKNNGEAIRMPNDRNYKNKNNLVTPTLFLKPDVDIDEFDLNGGDQTKFPQPKKKPSRASISESINKQGMIFKITESGNLKPYFLNLCNKDIYYYKTEKCEELIGMHNLSGAFVVEENKKTEVEIDGKLLYQFSIQFSHKTRTYYSESKQDAESWISVIKLAVGYKNFFDVYKIEDTIGEGKFGVVKLGIHNKTQEKVAIKIIKKVDMTSKDLELVKSEIDIMKMCKHQNIVRLLDHFENKEYTFIVMEYLAGNTLAHYLETTPVDALTEFDCGKITYQISKALDYLHTFGIVHRDLKPENIMIKGKLPYESMDSIKIMDFGLSKILGPNEKVNDGFGTLTYVAPEVLTRKPYNNSVDIWSLGVLVFYTLSGTFPFDDPSNDEEIIAKKIVFQELKFNHKSWISRTPEVKDFISKTMIKEIDKRIKIKDAVNHPWFLECGIQGINSSPIKKEKKKKNSVTFDN